MIVQLALFTQLAGSCAPHVAVETLASVARTESGFEALAVHDNTSGRTFKPSSREEAIALTTELVVVQRHSVDLGLMQINSLNLPSLGLTVTDAFDPCRNLAAAERILVQGYTAPPAGGDEQVALQQTLSRYNTGDPARGLANGYVGRIQASAEVIVPAIRVQGSSAILPAAASRNETAPILAQPLPPPPASWDVYGQARVARERAATASSISRPAVEASAASQTVTVSSSPSVASSASPGPVVLQPGFKQQATNEYR